jgi:hypothetical protein
MTHNTLLDEKKRALAAEPMADTSLTISSAFKKQLEQLVAAAGDQILLRIESRTPVAWPRWMTIKTAARYIDHSDRSFEYLMSKDLFPVVRRDRLVLLDREDVDAVLDKLKQ